MNQCCCLGRWCIFLSSSKGALQTLVWGFSIRPNEYKDLSGWCTPATHPLCIRGKGAPSFFFFSSFETTETDITDIFNLFLTQANVSACLIPATITLVPKQSNIRTLNDDGPVALTPITTKCFERLVLKLRKTSLPPDLSPDRGASRATRSTDKAITTALTQKGTYLRMFFYWLQRCF